MFANKSHAAFAKSATIRRIHLWFDARYSPAMSARERVGLEKTFFDLFPIPLFWIKPDLRRNRSNDLAIASGISHAGLAGLLFLKHPSCGNGARVISSRAKNKSVR